MPPPTPPDVMYVLPHAELGAFAEAVQSALAGLPVGDFFGSIPDVIVSEFRIRAYHALRGGAAPAEPVSPVRTPAPTAEETGMAAPVEQHGDAPAHSQYKYHVRKGGSTRYPDIVLAEVPDEEFDADEVWKDRLSVIVETESGRALETFRRSLLADKRFERIGESGYRFRRLVGRSVSLLDRFAEIGERNGQRE